MHNRVVDLSTRVAMSAEEIAVDVEEKAAADQVVIVVAMKVEEDAEEIAEEKETRIISKYIKIGRQCYSLNERNSEKCKKAA